MEIVHKDFRKGLVKLRITDPEDVWYLSHLVDAGDLLTGRTTRKIKMGEGENAKSTKKTLTLTIEAETIEMAVGGNSLRVNGKIKAGPEEVPKDSYHTLELEEGSEFTLEKKQWLAYQKQKLEEATERRRTYLLCVFDREEALLALTKKRGFEILLQLKGEAQKKRKMVEIKQDFYQEIIQALEEYTGRYQPEKVIIASPAFYKEDLYKKMSSPELKQKVVLAVCSDVSERALDEVMKRPELSAILKGSRAREEKLLMDELLSEINKEGLAVYGEKEVKKAVGAGAVKQLLLTEDFIQRKRSKNGFVELDDWMKQVEAVQGKMHFLSSEQEGGKKLDGLGGIAALLRYKLEW